LCHRPLLTKMYLNTWITQTQAIYLALQSILQTVLQRKPIMLKYSFKNIKNKYIIWV
jgi:hypothetical protein